MRKLSDLYSGIFQNYWSIFQSVKDTSQTILEYSRKFQNGEYSRIWTSIWNGPFQNLNWGLKNQNSELFLWNLMVKYWSDEIKFWVYTDFRAFRTWHQLLSLAGVYRSNRGMRVWVKTEDVLAMVAVLIFLLNFETVLMDGKMNNIIILQLQLQLEKPCAFFSNQFKSSNWPPLFVINLKNWYWSKTISFLKCPFIPTFLLILARRCDQKKWKRFLSRTHSLGSFLSTF